MTEAGRTVLGGGGITPDLFVMPETLAEDEIAAVQRVFRRGGAFSVARFNFAVEYVAEHPDLQVGFELGDDDVARFFETLPGGQGELGGAELARAERFVRYNLESEIALQAWGAEGQFSQLREYDRQLEEALEILDGVDTLDELFASVASTASAVAGG